MDGASERPGAGSPFRQLLDPAANLEALGDVTELGRRMVTEFAERLAEAPSATPAAESDPDAPSWDGVRRRLLRDGARAGEAGLDLVEDLLSLVALMARRGVPGTADSEPPVLVRGSPGAHASSLFWLRNAAVVPIAGVRPHAAAPRSHLGDELPAGAVTFDPPVLDPLPARSSCGIEVCVDVPTGTAPGLYTSVILVANLPRLWLPLQIVLAERGTNED
jgi:hypothetical protein